MDKNKIKRVVFFWIDKLQITKTERFSITILFSVIVLLLVLNIVIKEQVVPVPENHAELLAEFERRSGLIEAEEKKLTARYEGQVIEQEEKGIQDTVIIVNLNTASSEELQKLPGIGSSYAERIIDYRETNGGFNSVDELVNVRGIGEKTLEKLKPYIKL